MEANTKNQVRCDSTVTSEIETRLRADLAEAEKKAWDALARYKFQMFGYWAAIWVHLNRVGGFKLPNPFKTTVLLARNKVGSREVDTKPLLHGGETEFSRRLKRLNEAHERAIKPIKQR